MDGKKPEKIDFYTGKKLMSNIFIATIWPFAENRLNEIYTIIEQDYSIFEIEKLEFNITWSEMIKIVYADDKIKESKLLPKIEVLSKLPKFVYFVHIVVSDPKYFFKDDGRKMSKSMADLKKEVRAQFGPKYEADKNPLHIPDNVEHSMNFEKALEELE